MEAAAPHDVVYISETGLSKHAEEVLRFLSEAILHPLFPAEPLEKERVKALSRIEAEKKEPAALAGKLRDQVVFGNHPYGAHATADSIQKITRADAVKFHKKYSVLGGGFSGRLFQNLRERSGFTYGSSSNFDQRKLGGVFSATAEVRNEVTGKAVIEILNELKRIREEPIPEPELDLRKQYGRELSAQPRERPTQPGARARH